MASAAASSVDVDFDAAPMVCHLLLFDLRNSAELPPTMARSVKTVAQHYGHMLFVLVTGPSSSSLAAVVELQPRVSSSAIMRPSETPFRLRFLDLFSGFESAVR